MAIINKIENISSITYNGETINSLPAETLLLVLPTMLKTVDKLIADIGDTLTYTITITNLGLIAMSDIPFIDAIPIGSEYVEGSFELNETTVTPTITEGVLNYTIPSIPILGTAVIEFQVEVIGGEV